MVKTTIYFEGSANISNGDLREGFTTLLSRRIAISKFQVKLCNDKNSAIRVYNKATTPYKRVVVDLDKHENFRDAEIAVLNMQTQKDNCFFMVQEMEAWFLSQPDVCKGVFGNQFPAFTGNASVVDNPSSKLKELTRFKNQPYHKVKHAAELLKNLNIEKLENDFPDVKRLVETLSK